MRAWICLALVALVVCGLASTPFAQEADKLDTRLFKKDRTWLVKRETDPESYMQYKVKSVADGVAEVTQTELDAKKKPVANSEFTAKIKLTPDNFWFKIPEGAEVKSDQQVTVAAGTFDCIVYSFVGATVYKSRKYPGLVVKTVGSNGKGEELVEFKTFKDDDKDLPKGSKPVSDFVLYEKKGRTWRYEGHNPSFGDFTQSFEVTTATKKSATFKVTRRDSKGEPIKQWPDTEHDVEFNEKGKALLGTNVPRTRFVRRESIEVKAGKFDVDLHIAKAEMRGQDDHHVWMSVPFPGLLVKQECGKLHQELAELKLFKGESTSADGPAAEGPSAEEPPPEQPGNPPGAPGKSGQLGTELWREGRNWKVKRTLSSGDGQKGVVFLCTTVKAIQGDQATVKYETLDDKGVAATPAKDGQIAIESWCKDARDAIFEGGAPIEETIVVAGHKWLCWKIVADGKSGMAIDRRWYSQALSGLRIKLERGKDKTVTHREELSEIKLFEGESGKLDKKPDNATVVEGPLAPADWSLFKKKGRKWTSKSSSKYSTTFATYEILTVGKDFCEYKVATLDKDKKPIVAPSTLKLEFTEENAAMWVRPLPSYKKLREEKLKAAGVEWECIVYEGSLLEGQTQTLWVAKKYPGLHIKIVTKTGNSETLQELVEFKD